MDEKNGVTNKNDAEKLNVVEGTPFLLLKNSAPFYKNGGHCRGKNGGFGRGVCRCGGYGSDGGGGLHRRRRGGGGGVGVGGGGGGGIVTHRGGEVVAVYGDRAGRFDSGSGSRSRGGRRDCGGILGKKTCVTNIKSCLSVLGMSK